MNSRRSPIAAAPLLAAPVRALAWFNTRHPYSHNDYFHDWILSNLPEQRRRALDVGCGEGLLAERLSPYFGEMVAADRDAAMRAATSARGTTRAATSQPLQVIDGFDSAQGEFDLITMVAALHHLPLRPTLEHCRHLLSPGGRLLVVGLARPTTAPADLVWELGSAVANPVLGFLAHPRPHRGARPAPPFPVTDPQETVAEIATAAAEVLGPEARVTRRIPFRYTLSWRSPAQSGG